MNGPTVHSDVRTPVPWTHAKCSFGSKGLLTCHFRAISSGAGGGITEYYFGEDPKAMRSIYVQTQTFENRLIQQGYVIEP